MDNDQLTANFQRAARLLIFTLEADDADSGPFNRAFKEAVESGHAPGVLMMVLRLVHQLADYDEDVLARLRQLLGTVRTVE